MADDREPSDRAIEAAILEALRHRAPGRTICPSDAARRLSDDWRALMPRVRAVAGRMAREGRIVATRRGVPVDPEAPGGPIRLAATGA
jgi:hypothetical protein